MKTRQLFLPRPLRLLHKKSRMALVRWNKHLLNFALRVGFPGWIAQDLASRQISGMALRLKKGTLLVATPKALLRYASNEKAVNRLRRELEGWQRMGAAGFGTLIPRSMEMRNISPERAILSSEMLSPIPREEHMPYMLPVVRVLHARADVRTEQDLPGSVEGGLALARQVLGGELPASFMTEAELAGCFRQPLRRGYSHADLHWRNVMRRREEPVLVDLKKCSDNRVLALDILNMACQTMATLHGGNVLSQSFRGQSSNWSEPALAELITLVDLPRAHWGPLYVLHALGLHALRHGGTPNAASAALFRKLLNRDWRLRSS